MRVVIVHGAYGSPEENWIPWLKQELEKLECRVIVPRFPTPEGQELNAWLEILDQAVPGWNKGIILVGHSLGPALILKKIEELKRPIRAAFLVAGAVGPIGIEEFDSINVSFFEKGFVWAEIKQNCQNFFVYNSDNDPYVPLSHGKGLAQSLGVELKVIPQGGHLNEAAGYTQFPRLLEDIKKLL